jgi:hypothetical protein
MLWLLDSGNGGRAEDPLYRRDGVLWSVVRVRICDPVSELELLICIRVKV